MEKQLMDAIEALHGGAGCDYVSGTGTFVARVGLIKSFISNEDGTKISSIKEVILPAATETTLTGAHRSYLNNIMIGDNKFIIFDQLVKEIKLSAGSGWVFYQSV